MPPSVVHICFRNINFRSCHAIDCEIIFYVEISRLKKFVVYILVSVPCIVVMAGANWKHQQASKQAARTDLVMHLGFLQGANHCKPIEFSTPLMLQCGAILWSLAVDYSHSLQMAPLHC